MKLPLFFDWLRWDAPRSPLINEFHFQTKKTVLYCQGMLSICCLNAPKKKAFGAINSEGFYLFGSSTWARTRDLRINSPALYRLSYRGIDEDYSLIFIRCQIRPGFGLICPQTSCFMGFMLFI